MNNKLHIFAQVHSDIRQHYFINEVYTLFNGRNVGKTEEGLVLVRSPKAGGHSLR